MNKQNIIDRNVPGRRAVDRTNAVTMPAVIGLLGSLLGGAFPTWITYELYGEVKKNSANWESTLVLIHQSTQNDTFQLNKIHNLEKANIELTHRLAATQKEVDELKN